jgi:hypothetical protein
MHSNAKYNHLKIYALGKIIMQANDMYLSRWQLLSAIKPHPFLIYEYNSLEEGKISIIKNKNLIVLSNQFALWS